MTGAVATAGGHQAERARDAAGEALAAIEDAVKRKPTQTLGIALGIGFLVGVSCGASGCSHARAVKEP